MPLNGFQNIHFYLTNIEFYVIAILLKKIIYYKERSKRMRSVVENSVLVLTERQGLIVTLVKNQSAFANSEVQHVHQ